MIEIHEKEQILKLTRMAIDELTDWLLNNTKSSFEEQPDIDDVRSLLQDIENIIAHPNSA